MKTQKPKTKREDIDIDKLDLPLFGELSARKVWQAAKADLQVQFSKSTFNAWVAAIDILDCNPETNYFGLSVPTADHLTWLTNRQTTTFNRVFTAITNRPCVVGFTLIESEPAQ